MHNVSKRFGGLQALTAIDFELAEEEILSLTAPNGAGKTTHFNAINGVSPLGQGRAFFAGAASPACRPAPWPSSASHARISSCAR